MSVNSKKVLIEKKNIFHKFTAKDEQKFISQIHSEGRTTEWQTGCDTSRVALLSKAW